MRPLHVVIWFVLAALAIGVGFYLGKLWPMIICSVIATGCIFGGLHDNVERMLDRSKRERK